MDMQLFTTERTGSFTDKLRPKRSRLGKLPVEDISRKSLPLSTACREAIHKVRGTRDSIIGWEVESSSPVKVVYS